MTWGGTPGSGPLTLDGALLFSPDNTLDIGASGATRPRDLFLGRNLTMGGNLVVSGVGPHAIGGTTNSRFQVFIQGTFTATGVSPVTGLLVNSTIIPPVGSDAHGLISAITLNKAASGTHGVFSGVQIQAPIIGAGAASLTNAASLYIEGAPTGATNNYALWVVAGDIRFSGAGAFGFLANPVLGPGFAFSTDVFIFRSGTSSYQWNNQANTLERMRLTDGGILALGTTVTTGAAAGDLVLANTKSVRWVNGAGTTTLQGFQIGFDDSLLYRADGGRFKPGAGAARFHIPVVATASLPAAGADEDGSILTEDAGAGDRNIIIYAVGQRFRIDGGAAF